MKRRGSQFKQAKRVLFSIPSLLIMAVLTVVVAVAAWNMYQTHEDTQARVQRLQAERSELASRKQAAQSAAAQISTQRGLEEEIREKFSVAKPGERVIVLNDAERQAASSSQPTDRGWWQRVLSVVGLGKEK